MWGEGGEWRQLYFNNKKNKETKAKTALQRNHRSPFPSCSCSCSGLGRAPFCGVYTYYSSNCCLSPLGCSPFSEHCRAGVSFYVICSWYFLNKLGFCRGGGGRRMKSTIPYGYEQKHSLEKNTHAAYPCPKQAYFYRQIYILRKAWIVTYLMTVESVILEACQKERGCEHIKLIFIILFMLFPTDRK